jgi:hypothetical protein
MNNLHRQLSGALLLCATAFAHAQSAAPASAPHGLPESQAFKSYRGFAVEPVSSWPAANKMVEQIGGWRTYAREASETPVPAAAIAGTKPNVSPGQAPASPVGTKP